MKTAISPENPLLDSVRFEQAYAWERLRALANERGPLRLLDYGTHDGTMLRFFSATGIVSAAVGVDLNATALDSVPASEERVTLQAVVKGEPLAFPDASFDAVTLIGVLEHVHRQDVLLSELHRVLTEDGRLIVSVPGQHLFSFLDLGNLKFRFPKIHRWYYTHRYSSDDYNKRYVEGENGLIGDIESEKRWHEHFTLSHLESLLISAGFQLLDADGFGYFFRVIHNVHYLSPVFKEPLRKLMHLDMQAFESAEIFIECRKAPPIPSTPFRAD